MNDAYRAGHSVHWPFSEHTAARTHSGVSGKLESANVSALTDRTKPLRYNYRVYITKSHIPASKDGYSFLRRSTIYTTIR